MIYLVVLTVFIQEIAFKIMNLWQRKLLEGWYTSMDILYTYRFIFFPWLIAFIYTFDMNAVNLIFSDLKYIIYMFSVFILWTIWALIMFKWLSATSTISHYWIISKFTSIPLILLFSFYINWDIPNLLVVLALFFLLIWTVLRPSNHTENTNKSLKYWNYTYLLLLLPAFFFYLDLSLFREILLLINNPFFGSSIFILWLWIIINVLYFIKLLSLKFKNKTIKKTNSKNINNVLFVSSLFFLWTFLEWYNYTTVPVFTVAALWIITFLIDILSDYKNKRIKFDINTVIFILISIIWLILATLSLK